MLNFLEVYLDKETYKRVIDKINQDGLDHNDTIQKIQDSNMIRWLRPVDYQYYCKGRAIAFLYNQFSP